MNRAWALVALAVSLAVTAALWLAGFPGFFLFLLLPFAFLPFGKYGHKACPEGHFETRHPAYRHCPTCGERLR